jgi:hypothetical protein
MEADYLAIVEVGIARALREIDRAAMVARHVQENPQTLRNGKAADRLREDARRVLVIRKSIIAANIPLPDLRDIEQRDELPSVDPENLSIGQIAIMSGLDRSSITRRLQKIDGAIAEKYAKGRQTGVWATFTMAEALQIINSTGIGGRE